MQGVIVCPEPLVALAGAHVLCLGGSAIDAAIATAFAQAVVSFPYGKVVLRPTQRLERASPTIRSRMSPTGSVKGDERPTGVRRARIIPADSSGQRPPLSFRYLSSSDSVERMSQVFSSRLLFNVSIVFQNW